MLRPLNDSVVVEPLKAGETTPGGLVIPENARDRFHGLRALVLAVGPGSWTIGGSRLPIDLKPGDVVILRAAGPLVSEGGRVYCIVPDRDVLAVIEGGDQQNGARRYGRHEYAPDLTSLKAETPTR